METTIYQLPTWAETTLVICVAVMLAGLAAWLSCKAIQEAIDAESKLQHKCRASEAKALNKWQRLYEEERNKRAEDNANLISEILELQSKVKELQGKIDRTDKRLAKVKGKDLLAKMEAEL